MKSDRSPAAVSMRPLCRLVVAFAAAFVASGPLVALGQGLALRDPGVAVMRDLQVDLQALAALAQTARQTTPLANQGPPMDRLLAAIDRIRAADLLLDDHHRVLDERLQRDGASAAVLLRHRDNTRLFRERLDRLYRAAAPLTPPPDNPVVDATRVRVAMDAIVEALADVGDQSSRTPIGATLPYRSLALPQMAPRFDATITPAYLTSPLPAPLAADLADTPDTEFTPEIRAKAAALAQSPIAIFEFVQNDVRSEFYYGAMKDASETLRQLSGNDTDQASLLIALLRASRIPARYVRGVIRLTGPQALSWTGVGTTRRAAEIFTRAGIPFRPVLQGGTVGAFEIEHTWVEAYVAYSNYRGVRLGSIGQAWIPLDPSFKAIDASPGVDLNAAMGFRADTLVPDYLSAPQALSPMDFYRQRITDYLAQSRPDLTFEQVMATRTTRPVRSGLLPSTLPYVVVSAHEESPALADVLRHRVRFVAEGEGGVSFDVTVSAAELAGRRLTLSYVPATVEDQVAAHAFLGLDNTPAYLVKLRPVLKIGGAVKAAGATPVQMGAFHSFTVEVQTPRGVVPLVNAVLAGGYYAVGLASQPAPYEIPLVRAPDDTEHPAADRLYSLATDYAVRWNAAEHALERILRVVNVRPALSQVMVGTVFARTVLFGQPQSIEWRGVFVDADLRVAEPVPTGTDDARAREFMRLSGLAGSALEADVLQLNLQVDAVSAAKVIQLARAGGVPIEEVDATNVAEVLARLQTAPVVKTEIADAVNQGWRVTIPRRDLTQNIWTGIGYVMIDPATGAGGYFISGGLAGGMTILPPESWPDQPIAEELGSPNAEPPNTDPAAVRYLTKIAITDKQNGTVDEPLGRMLAVWARDDEGRSVEGATVTFVAQFGGGRFEATDTFTATTDYQGIAKAPYTLGRRTSDLPFFVRVNPSDGHVTQVGQNIVTAFVTGGAAPVFVPAPFQHFAYPGPAARIVKQLGDGGEAAAGTAGGSLLARVEDEFGNPVSNATVNFEVLPPATIVPTGAINLKVYSHDPPCAVTTPILGDCGGLAQLTTATSTVGAAVNTILGNTYGTTFQVRASTSQDSAVPFQVFTLRSSGSRDYGSGSYHTPTLVLSRVELVSDRGTPLNAALAGSVLSQPLEALLFVLEDDSFTLEPTGEPCPQPSDPCYRLRSRETVRARPINVDAPVETAAVQFVAAAGGGLTTPASNAGGGRYRSALTLGQAPALNRVDVTANAAILVPCFDLHAGTITPTLVTLQAGQFVTASSIVACANGPLTAGGAPQTVEHTVFGVRATVSDAAVPVSAEGITLDSVPIGYQIQPPAYVSAVADVDLFEVGSGGDTWKGALPGTPRSGVGESLLLQGTGFDLTKTYQTQLVLNRGTAVEMRSPRAALTLLNPVELTLAARDRAVVKTYLDRSNQTSCSAMGALLFTLSDEARVTVRVDGNLLITSGATGPVTWDNVTLSSGDHVVPVTAGAVPLPGAHTFAITAMFAAQGLPDVVRTAEGSIQHDVVIQAFLPIGHTLVKGVDLLNGQFSLVREDLSIPGHGPTLQFTRSYGSAGHRSSGPMGAGWGHNYNGRIVRDPCGTITLVGGEGSGIKFGQPTPGTDAQGNAIETYRPQAGYHGRLVLNGPDGSYDFFTKQGVRYHYEKDFSPGQEVFENRLAFIEDSNRNRLTLTYEAGTPFNLQTVMDASGRTLTFTYQPFGLVRENRLTRIDGPLGLVVTYQYDEFGNLKTASRDVKVERYEYTVGNAEDRHNLTGVLGPNNGVTGPNTDVTLVSYFTGQDQIPGWIANPQLFAEKYEMVKSVTDGAGSAQAAAHQFAYDYTAPTTGFVTTVADPLQVRTAYTIHPAFGAVVEKRIILATGDNLTTTRWAFQDGINDVFITSTTDPNGRITSYTYDLNGNPVRQTVHAGTAPYVLPTDAGGSPVEQVVAESHYHPVFGRVTREIDAEGRITDYALDASTGNVVTATTYPGGDQAAVVTRYAYFENGPLRGLLHTVTDPRDRVTTYETYDDFGNATRVVEPEGNITTYVYDARSRRREVRDTRGHLTTYDYDELDHTIGVSRMTGAQPADLAMTSVPTRQTVTTYFPGGQPQTATNGNGHVTTFGYDAINRQILQEDVVLDADGGSSTLRLQAAWDGNGNKIREIDRREILQEFRYDGLNRVIETRVEGQVIASQTYDAAGNRLSQADLHGHVTGVEHDALYRPVRAIFALPQYSTRTRYDLVGNVLEAIDANGHSIVNTYDGLDRLTSTTDALGQTKRIEHDAVGNRVLEHDLGTGLRVRYEGYDGINRPAVMRQEFIDPLTGAAVEYTTIYAYLDAQNTRVTTSPRGVVLSERFNGHDALIERVVDMAGLRLQTTYRYDGNGNLTGEKDSEGGVIDKAFTYDGLNRRTSAAYPLGARERWFYDGNGNLTRTIDRRDIVQTTDYDHLNRKISDTLVESISNSGVELAVTSIVYDDAGNATTVTDANRNSTRQFDDAMHRPVRVVDSLNQETLHEWDAANRIAQVDKRRIRTEFVYDAMDRLTGTRRLLDTGPQVTRTTYLDAQSRRIDTDPAGVDTIIQFDAVQRARRTSKRHAGLVAPYGAAEFMVEERAYDAHGNVTAITDGNGTVTRFDYDNGDRQVGVTEGFGSPVQASTVMTYDRAGNPLTTKDARLTGRPFDSRSTYDLRNRQVLSENSAGDTTTYFYDQGDNLRVAVDPRGGTTTFTHDEVGKLLSVDDTRDGTGGITRYRYDPNRNLVAQQDANGNLSTWHYDTLNRQTDSLQHTSAGALAVDQPRTASPGGDDTTALHWHYEFDESSNQTLIVDAEGQRVLKSYDQLDQLTLKTFQNHRPGPGGAPIFPRPLSIAYRYDANGNLRQSDEIKQLESGTVTETGLMEYDPLDRLVLRTNSDGKTLRFEYDRVGNETAIVDADGTRTTHGIDARQRIATATAGGTTTAYAYWPDSLQRTVTYPNGVVAEMNYDAADRLTRIANHNGDLAAPISQFDYTYDANGNRLTQIERHARLNGGAAQQTTYRYDALDRLVGVDYPGAAGMTYGYAPNGNRIGETGVRPVTDSATARSYGYNRLNQLTTITDTADPGASVALQYDRNGNTTGQKVGAIDPSSGDIPAPTVVKTYAWDIRDYLARTDGAVGAVTFDYDYAGRRVKMVSPFADIRYLHDEARVVQEYDGANLSTTLRYTYGPAGLSSIDAGATGGRSFYLRDALGSTSELTDGAGATKASYAYDPWGQVLVSFDTTPNRRRFTGHYADTETGLQFFGARYYDETTGRFLSQDPYLGESGNPATLHRYQYALANPLRYVDPTGYASQAANDGVDVGNPCRGVVVQCNPATKDVDDYTDGVNREYLKRAAREGQELAEMLGRPGGGDPLTGMHTAPTGIYKTRGEIYKKFDQWQRTEQLVETTQREELLTRMDEAAQGGLGDMATFRWMLLAEEVAAADPDSMFAAGTAALMHGAGSYLQMSLNLGAASGELSGKLQSGQDTTFWDWFAAAGDVATLLEPVGAVIGGAKQALKAIAPATAAIGAEQAALKLYAHVHDLTIGIRAADPITAAVTRVLTYMKIPAKPELVKGKSFYGLSVSLKGVFRSDLDIAYIRNAAGELLDNDAVLKIAGELNALTGLKSFQHGSHATALKHAGGGPTHSLTKYGSFGNPGPVTEFTAAGKTTWSMREVRGMFMAESFTHIPGSAKAREGMKALVGRWHTAWDKNKPLRFSVADPFTVTTQGLSDVQKANDAKKK